MKQLFTGLFLLTLLLGAGSSQAKTVHDSVFVELPNRNTMILVTPYKKALAEFTGVNALIAEIQERLPALEPSLIDPLGYTKLTLIVRESGKRELVIDHEPEKQAAITWDNNNKHEVGKLRPDHVVLKFPNRSKIIFVLNSYKEVNQLQDILLDGLLAEVQPHIDGAGPHRKRGPALKMYYLLTDTGERVFESQTGGQDRLELSGGAGASLIRKQAVPEFGLSVGFHSSGRDWELKRKIRLNYSMQYFFADKPEGGISTDIQSFIIAEYAHNYAGYKEDPSWFSVGLGYLLSDGGDVYEGTTMKLYLMHSLRSGIFVAPELYATNDFGSFFPALRVGIGI